MYTSKTSHKHGPAGCPDVHVVIELVFLSAAHLVAE